MTPEPTLAASCLQTSCLYLFKDDTRNVEKGIGNVNIAKVRKKGKKIVKEVSISLWILENYRREGGSEPKQTYTHLPQWTRSALKAVNVYAWCLVSFVPGILPGIVGVCWTNKGNFIFTCFKFGQVYLAHLSSCDDSCLVVFQTLYYLSTAQRLRGPGRQLDSWNWLTRPVLAKLTHFMWILKRKDFLNTCSNMWFSLEDFEWGAKFKAVRSSSLIKVVWLLSQGGCDPVGDIHMSTIFRILPELPSWTPGAAACISPTPQNASLLWLPKRQGQGPAGLGTAHSTAQTQYLIHNWGAQTVCKSEDQSFDIYFHNPSWRRSKARERVHE